MRRRVLGLVITVLTAGSLAIGTTAVTAGASAPAKKITKCAKKSAAKGIKKALVVFLTGETSADKIAYIDVAPDQTEAFTAALQASSDAADASGSALPVTADAVKAKCDGKTAATFTYDLVSSETGDPLLPDQAGNAALKGGKWLLDPVFVCDLTDQNPDAAGPISTQCYTAIGLDDPTP